LFEHPKKPLAQFPHRPQTRAGSGFAGSALFRAKEAKLATGVMRRQISDVAMQYPHNEKCDCSAAMNSGTEIARVQRAQSRAQKEKDIQR
jgi:hypothetical protein